MSERAAPCGCGSLYRHLPVCPIYHPDIAALPSRMPKTVRVGVNGVYVELKSSLCNITPDEARTIARALLLNANAAERQGEVRDG